MRGLRFVLTGLLVGLCFGCVLDEAFARKIYWADVIDGKIQSANLDGTGVAEVVSTLTLGSTRPAGIVVDSLHARIYWTDFFNGIHRVNADGTNAQTMFAVPSGRTDIQGIALDPVNKQIYWGPDHPFNSPLGPAQIRRSNLDFSTTDVLLSNAVDGFPSGLGLDLTGGKMYWGNPTSAAFPVTNRLKRANLDGTFPETLLSLDGVCDPRYVAVDQTARKVYFTCGFAGAVMRVNVDGSGLETLVQGLSFPLGIDLDVATGKMYFAEQAGGRVSRANFNGSNVEALVTGLTAPQGISLEFGPCVANTSISADFDSTAISEGTTLWFNSNFQAVGHPRDKTTKVFFQDGRIQFTTGGVAYDLPVPDAEITFSSTAACSSTTFDNNAWRTTLPTRRGAQVFLTGLAFPVPPGGLPGGITGVTWRGRFRTDTSGVSVDWKWSAAAYGNFPNPTPDPETAYNALGIKSTHVKACAYDNADQAGTPENFKNFVVDGPRGDQGGKWTGDWSEIANLLICPMP